MTDHIGDINEKVVRDALKADLAAAREREEAAGEAAVRFGYRLCYDAHSHDPSGLYLGRILDEAVARWRERRGKT